MRCKTHFLMNNLRHPMRRIKLVIIVRNSIKIFKKCLVATSNRSDQASLDVHYSLVIMIGKYIKHTRYTPRDWVGLTTKNSANETNTEAKTQATWWLDHSPPMIIAHGSNRPICSNVSFLYWMPWCLHAGKLKQIVMGFFISLKMICTIGK